MQVFVESNVPFQKQKKVLSKTFQLELEYFISLLQILALAVLYIILNIRILK